jgi:RimJ/RimL family protein N-acetyltransferase
VDNVRSGKLIEAAGFRPMGEREVMKPDGSARRSLYWELTRGKNGGKGTGSEAD